MTLGIGVIGAGMIGRDHARRIERVLSGARVAGLYDVAAGAAQAAIDALGLAAKDHASPASLIAAADAVLVTSSAASHEALVLEAIAAGKPVFCEKPLATSAAGARRIVEAELAAGRRLVQVGFMRRYDPGYVALKEAVAAELGAPLMVHAAHRNASAGPGYTREMAIHETAIHEIDVLRWLLGDEYVSARVLVPRPSRHAKPGDMDPQIVLLETAGGVRVDIEIFVNCRYGYDIQCEVVGEEGTARLPEPETVILRKAGRLGRPILQDWKARFALAYDAELQHFIDAAGRGELGGPSAWDGHVAALVADACVGAQRAPGSAVAISLPERPALYA